MPTLRLATRGSAQARTQAEAVAAALRATGADAELVLVETTGDRRQDVPLHVIGGQGVFVKEVQQAVLDGRADAAVHSAKDLPSTSHEALTIGAFTARRDAADALVGRSLADLADGATVATGSVRRQAQLRRVRPDLHLVELRGNIATRLERIPDGGSIVMAVAALQVLGLTERIASVSTRRCSCQRSVRAASPSRSARRRGHAVSGRRPRRRRHPSCRRGRASLPRRAGLGLLAAARWPCRRRSACTSFLASARRRPRARSCRLCSTVERGRPRPRGGPGGRPTGPSGGGS